MNRWHQTQFALPARPRGCHLITDEIVQGAAGIRSCRAGLMHVFLQHTSAALTINENADPDVPLDLAMALDRLAPESLNYRHTCEGPDDMPAHVKTTVSGNSLSIPIGQGRLLLGTWQGIYLCEFRNRAGRRHVVVTIQGDFDDQENSD